MADEDEERRRLSPDSSTQVLSKKKQKHKRKKKHKHNSNKRKRKHSEDRVSDLDVHQSDSSNHSVVALDDERPQNKNEKQLTIDIKPLTEYIDDTKALNNELFEVLSRKEMKKLMPKSVKKLDVDELKSRCLDQLEIISKKRLLRIMDGQEMNSSSTSDSEHEAAKDTIDTVKQIPVLEESHKQPVPEMREAESLQSVNIMEELSVGPDQNEIDELIEGPAGDSISEDKMAVGDDVGGEKKDSGDESGADTTSQLMELEYRARALKSLMQARKRLDT